MKRPSVIGGIVLAFLVAVLATASWWAFCALIPSPSAFKSVLVIGYLGYVFYLLWAKGSRVGGVTLATANVMVAIAVSLLPLTIPMTACALAALLSLNRSLLWHRSLAALALDGALTTVALLFAGHLYARSGSLPPSMWGFFLLQSLWVLIPSRISLMTGLGESPDGVEGDRFTQGHRQAESALERLTEESWR